MRPRSLRAQLWLWLTGITIAILGLAGFVIFESTESVLRDALDEKLLASASAIAPFCEWEEDRGRVDFDAEDAGLALETINALGGVDLRLLPSGARLAQYGLALPSFAIEGGLPRFAAGRTSAVVGDDDVERAVDFVTAEIHEGRARICRLRLRRAAVGSGAEDDRDAPAHEFLVRVIAELEPIEAQVDRIGLRILGVAAAAALVLVIFGGFLSRRIIEPLRALERSAALVEDGVIAAMPNRRRGDEIDLLAQRLDRAFRGLGEALARQRRFTASAAHELRNPIAVIGTAAEVGARPERRPEEVRELLEDIAVTAERMGGIVESLLLLARLESGEESDLTAPMFLDGMIARQLRRRPEDVRRRITVAGAEGVEIRGHEGLLDLLLGNLLDNAARHGGAGPIAIEVEVGATEIELSVRDHGPGIAAEHRARIFEPFFRVDDRTSGVDGVGLGLAIVSAVVRFHHGRVVVTDAEPGTRVRVTLPRAPFLERHAGS